MKIKIYLNDGEDHYFGFDPETAELTMVHEFEISEPPNWNFSEDGFFHILGWCFEEFNVGTGPQAQAYRAKMLRSLSVGDVVSVGETAYKCCSIGWERITTEELQNAIIWNDTTNSVL